MHCYTNSELVTMHLMYGVANVWKWNNSSNNTFDRDLFRPSGSVSRFHTTGLGSIPGLDKISDEHNSRLFNLASADNRQTILQNFLRSSERALIDVLP
ncbi:hypothetical protein TNCV_5095461 [Trichonephila clavipes]|nr:hypothetical protein TNCV_5095461 [Trichonephila clavipes]